MMFETGLTCTCQKLKKPWKVLFPVTRKQFNCLFLLMINVEWYESWPSGKEKDKSEKQGQKIRGPGADDRYISTKK